MCRVTCILTLEHVGLVSDGDIEAMQEIKRLLKPRGRVYITVPYGREYRINWDGKFRIYNVERLRRICEGFMILEKACFAVCRGKGFLHSDEKYVQFSKSESLICLALEKPRV